MTLLQLWEMTQGILILKETGEEVNSGVALAHSKDEVTGLEMGKYHDEQYNVTLPCIYVTI